MVKRASRLAAQSAMEYLMTYGWAILIIAVVLAALFELGVFNGSNLAPQGCIAQAGFTCTNFVYTSNAIGFTFGQTTGRDYYGNWIFVASQDEALNQNGIPVNFACTATGCANATPVGLPGPNGVRVLVPGQTVTAVFPADVFHAGGVPSNPPIGTPFAGYIWLGYCMSPCSSPTAFSKVATVTAKASGVTLEGGAGLSSAPTAYVPITLSLSAAASSSTPTGFQQNLTVPSSNYMQYINGDWSNVEFTTGPDGTGTTMQAWVESDPSNTATATTVWVNLGGQTISPGGNTIIYMDFMPTNVMSASGPTGEAPQLSASYAQYDNGALVFPTFYDNFAGSYTYVNDSGIQTGTPPPGFFAVNAVVTVDNGLVLFNSTGATNNDGPLFATTSEYGVGTTFDADIVSLPSSDTVNIGYQELPYNPGPSPQYGTFIRQGCGNTYPDQINFTNGEANVCGFSFFYGSFFNGENSPGVYSVTIVSSKESYQTYDYSAGGTSQPIAVSFPEPPEIPGGYPTYVGFSASHGGISLPVQWVRIRKAPPPSSSGVPIMPQASFGSLQHA